MITNYYNNEDRGYGNGDNDENDNGGNKDVEKGNNQQKKTKLAVPSRPNSSIKTSGAQDLRSRSFCPAVRAPSAQERGNGPHESPSALERPRRGRSGQSVPGGFARKSTLSTGARMQALDAHRY